MNSRLLLLSFSISTWLFFWSHFFCVDYPTGGTNTVQVFNSKQTLNGGDTVGTTNAGIVWFKEGFNVSDTVTDINFVDMAVGVPVSGQMDFGGSGNTILHLANDLVFVGESSLGHSGKIDFDGNTLSLIGYFDFLDNRITVTNLSGSTRTAIVDGDGNRVRVGSGGITVICPVYDFNFYIQQMYLEYMGSNSFIFDGPGANIDLILKNMVLELNSDVYLGKDCDFVFIEGDVLVKGPGHALCIDTELKIGSNGRLIFDIGTTFSAGLHCDMDMYAGGTLYLNGCNVEIGDNIGVAGDENYGIRMTNGRVIFDNRVTINDDGNNKAFQVLGSAEAIVLPGTQIILDGTTTFSIA